LVNPIPCPLSLTKGKGEIIFGRGTLASLSTFLSLFFPRRGGQGVRLVEILV
jgi:hypothetical protein